MKVRALCSLFLFAASFNAAAITQFKPAVLNAALLFEHDPTIGNVKHRVQWIRDVNGKLRVMTEVRYDRNGCFTHINMVDKENTRIQSCSYTVDGNADKCSLISSANEEYRGSILFWVSNHETEYF